MKKFSFGSKVKGQTIYVCFTKEERVDLEKYAKQKRESLTSIIRESVRDFLLKKKLEEEAKKKSNEKEEKPQTLTLEPVPMIKPGEVEKAMFAESKFISSVLGGSETSEEDVELYESLAKHILGADGEEDKNNRIKHAIKRVKTVRPLTNKGDDNIVRELEKAVFRLKTIEQKVGIASYFEEDLGKDSLHKVTSAIVSENEPVQYKRIENEDTEEKEEDIEPEEIVFGSQK